MKRLLSITASVLLVLFSVAQAGIPILLHSCKSEGTVSLSVCQNCKEHAKPKKLSCCASKKTDTRPSYKSARCCEETLALSPLSADFLAPKIGIKAASFASVVLFMPTFGEVFQRKSSSIRSQTAHAPPPDNLCRNDVYLSNSVLLI